MPAPTVWQAGVISQALHDTTPAFSPDGATVYFGRSGGAALPKPTIFVAQRRGGRWSDAAVASFSGRHADLEPAMAPDGSYMVFVSNRPAHVGEAPLDGAWDGKSYPGAGGALWRSERTRSGWTSPQRLPEAINAGGSTFAPAIAGDGRLYFMRPDAVTHRFRLYTAAWRDGAYADPEPLAFSTGATSDVDPAVAKDGSFLVFGSSAARVGLKRDMDLFIVFRRPDGGWGTPVHLGSKVNAPGSDAEARLSPDNRTLYFSSERIDPGAPHDSAGWNNGLYNIWSVGLPEPALKRLAHLSLTAPEGLAGVSSED